MCICTELHVACIADFSVSSYLEKARGKGKSRKCMGQEQNRLGCMAPLLFSLFMYNAPISLHCNLALHYLVYILHVSNFAVLTDA